MCVNIMIYVSYNTCFSLWDYAALSKNLVIEKGILLIVYTDTEDYYTKDTSRNKFLKGETFIAKETIKKNYW